MDFTARRSRTALTTGGRNQHLNALLRTTPLHALHPYAYHHLPTTRVAVRVAVRQQRAVASISLLAGRQATRCSLANIQWLALHGGVVGCTVLRLVPGRVADALFNHSPIAISSGPRLTGITHWRCARNMLFERMRHGSLT